MWKENIINYSYDWKWPESVLDWYFCKCRQAFRTAREKNIVTVKANWWRKQVCWSEI